MKKYTKLIILSVVLLVIIVLITLAMIFDVNLLLFNNLSISGIQKKKLDVETLMAQETMEEINNVNAKENLQSSKDSFDVAKQKYENIDESTIEIVKEATKEEKYFIEYLWIVLGNYARANNVGISIITPDSTVEKEEQDTTNGNTSNNNNTNNTNDATSIENSLSAISNGVKIMVEGRYANVADFVFDVENDKSLRFKLDNIKMAYAGNNTIQAVFDVLSLSVLK